MNQQASITQAVDVLKQGGLIAYPTEAIYGIGCDPFNEAAVKKVYAVKQRPLKLGLILIAADFSQVEDLIVPTEHMEAVMQSWPGPNTWVFPVTKKVPNILKGQFSSIAVRVTDHPIAKALCSEFGGPIVSTSANLSGKQPVKLWQDLDPEILTGIDFIIKGPVGDREKCSSIRDAHTLRIIR